MKSLIVGLLLTGSLAAQQFPVLTWGPWAICESPAGPSISFCAGFTPGHEKYLLPVTATHSETIGYRYTVTGILINTGEKVTASGMTERRDFPGSFTQTPIILDFGGIAGNFEVTVQELAVI